ncbi:uncharacterized protein CLUP02_15191 [Colletotrichum lupini]|uniref:Uncharacterized protein n=1 Tax=Colletotrichum lupini TaxID=145971 RepID=A0A9Q8WP08_9PEZI|nr:uncharacterized protein CLUP02_15191 [Colletotrichum lupini]UQC89660.1 hypothetical protein CLUP02_15191 [Colletotrichum lupini]
MLGTSARASLPRRYRLIIVTIILHTKHFRTSFSTTSDIHVLLLLRQDHLPTIALPSSHLVTNQKHKACPASSIGRARWFSIGTSSLTHHQPRRAQFPSAIEAHSPFLEIPFQGTGFLFFVQLTVACRACKENWVASASKNERQMNGVTVGVHDLTVQMQNAHLDEIFSCIVILQTLARISTGRAQSSSPSSTSHPPSAAARMTKSALFCA